MHGFLRRIARLGAAGAVVATSLVGTALPAQATVYAVTLTATEQVTTVGSYSTLIATANQYVALPNVIEIFDQSTSPPSLLASCYGTQCPASVTQSLGGVHTYIAFISTYSTNYPPDGLQATSNTVSVVWLGPPGSPSTGVGGPVGASALCDQGTQVIDQTTEGVHAKLYTLEPSLNELDVCVRVDQDGVGFGGEFVIRATPPSPGISGLGTPSADSNVTACQSTPGNSVPGSHPIENGTVAGVSVLIDAYADSSAAWVCFAASPLIPGVALRLVVPIPSPSITVGPLPSVSFTPDPGT